MWKQYKQGRLPMPLHCHGEVWETLSLSMKGKCVAYRCERGLATACARVGVWMALPLHSKKDSLSDDHVEVVQARSFADASPLPWRGMGNVVLKYEGKVRGLSMRARFGDCLRKGGRLDSASSS
jgi:hypothetical protein